MRLVLATMICAGALLASTAETHYFRAKLSSANEVPVNDYTGTGACTAVVHIVRGDNGRLKRKAQVAGVDGTLSFPTAWSSLGSLTIGGSRGTPAVGINSDGRLDVFITDTDGQAVHAPNVTT